MRAFSWLVWMIKVQIAILDDRLDYRELNQGLLSVSPLELLTKVARTLEPAICLLFQEWPEYGWRT